VLLCLKKASAAVPFMPLGRPGIAICSAAPGPDHTAVIQASFKEFSGSLHSPSFNPWDAIFGI